MNYNPADFVIEAHRGFALLSLRCLSCGDNLIWNYTGVECGGTVVRDCPHTEEGEKYDASKFTSDSKDKAP